VELDVGALVAAKKRLGVTVQRKSNADVRAWWSEAQPA